MSYFFFERTLFALPRNAVDQIGHEEISNPYVLNHDFRMLLYDFMTESHAVWFVAAPDFNRFWSLWLVESPTSRAKLKTIPSIFDHIGLIS